MITTRSARRRVFAGAPVALGLALVTTFVAAGSATAAATASAPGSGVDTAATLAATGATTSWLIPVAIGLLVLGAIALVITLVRRRTRR